MKMMFIFWVALRFVEHLALINIEEGRIEGMQNFSAYVLLLGLFMNDLVGGS